MTVKIGIGNLAANGLMNPFTGTKKYSITCGKCHHTWREKVPVAGDTASAVCPCCHEQNLFSHGEFARFYERESARESER